MSLLVDCACVCRDGPGVNLSPDQLCEFCHGSGTRQHPLMKYTRWHAICPVCGFNGGGNREKATDLAAFDVLGSDSGCVFCPQCHTEIAI